ncbi:hypothetical protein SO802_030133 [Lithocarpus litseifolius]|uniref:Uncharacterized protein n=1 Tax=Lithocarpus litseifolius TaxID=425828 RepID=A0AAW2BYF9_9ROSI
MAAPAQLGSSSSSSSSVPSLPPPRPKSPPAYPDLYGKRRETAKVQMLEREIGFLEESEDPSAMSLLEMALKGRAAAAAAVTAIHASIVHVIRVTVVSVSVVIFQSGSGVALVPVQIAVEKPHAEETVAISHLLHALIALAAYADARVLNVQRYALVAVVQTSVVTLAIYVTSIF